MPKFFKYIIVLSLFFSAAKINHAQQAPHYTQYLFNTQLYNPAYVESKDFLSLTLTSRVQWSPINGSPQTHNAFARTKLKNFPVGLGLSVGLDRIGPVDQQSINFDGAYSITATEKSTLAFGLKIGAEILNINLAKGSIADSGDPLLDESIASKISPLLGAGIYWYSEHWYAGVSVSNLLHATHFDGQVTDRPNYFLLAGYIFELNRNIKFKPALLTKVVSGAPLSLNFSANFMFNEAYTAGLSYNNGESLSAVLSADLSSVFTIGYSFDYSLRSLNQFDNGSHEIVLSYRFTESSKAHRCHTRFF